MFFPESMFRFGTVFLASVYSFLLKICGLIYKYVYRSKSSGVEENYSNFSANRSQNGSDFLQTDLIAKCQVMCGKNVSGFLEEPKTVKLMVQEMFVGSESSDDVLVRSDHNLGYEVSEKHDVESDSFSFHFDLLSDFCSTNQVSQEQISRGENIDQEREEDHPLYIYPEREDDHHYNINQEREEDHHFKIDQERADDHHFNINQEREEDHPSKIDQERADDHHFNINQEREEDHHFKLDQEREEGDHFNTLCSEEILEGRDNLNLNFSEEEIAEEQDFSYEVELLPTINSNQESDSGNWMSNFLDHNLSEKVGDLDDEYIELENLSFKLTHIDRESTSFDDSNKVEESQEQNLMQTEATTKFQQLQQRSCWDAESEEDVLSEHQNLVQQMKMELKACRIKGLPTISEECESPKMLEDLKPLDIDHKIEYKDIMQEIQKFHKIFSEKMRKLDILSYQTLHAISFLHLKDSEVFTAGKKKADLLPSVLPKNWQRKVQRIYADPMHKSITEMHRDLELVYVGQLCLSWEILSWLYVKARELLDYDCDGNHSYNRAAEEFQQFQVLIQRFMEDEPFQQHRNRGYVRSLLHVPIIRDDCLKTKKERGEKSDAVSLEMLVEIIRESMLIFRGFLFADKKSAKIDLQDLGKSELLSVIVSNLQKKERRTRDNIRSRNCIVKKLKGQRLDREMLTCEVELRLVVRVVNMSRLTGDQLVWCGKKLDNISFVGRRVHIEPSFLLFPC